MPAKLTLAPKTATNPVDLQHCVTATVQDRFGAATSDEPVDFKVSGDVTTIGSKTTDRNGQAQFCYPGAVFPGSDSITATARNGTKPSDTAAKSWIAPAGQECKVHGGGKIVAADGSVAKFHLKAKSDEDDKAKDEIRYESNPLDVEGKRLTSNPICSDDLTRATMFVRLPRAPDGTLILLRIDVVEGNRKGGQLRIRSQSGYDSGMQPLANGTIKISHSSH